MSKEARMRELIAAFMAMEMGLKVVEPVVIDISSDFIGTIMGKQYYSKMNSSRGNNVGSKYIKDYIILANEIALTPQQEVCAQYIFGFDLLIQNADRNFQKPNIITDGNELVMLDHELGFGFIFVPSFLRNGDVWDFKDVDLEWITKHCLFNRLSGKASELENFSAKIAALDDHFWDKTYKLIPVEWMNDEQYENIKQHILLLIEHKEEFITNIKSILS